MEAGWLVWNLSLLSTGLVRVLWEIGSQIQNACDWLWLAFQKEQVPIVILLKILQTKVGFWKYLFSRWRKRGIPLSSSLLSCLKQSLVGPNSVLGNSVLVSHMSGWNSMTGAIAAISRVCNSRKLEAEAELTSGSSHRRSLNSQIKYMPCNTFSFLLKEKR